MIPMLETARIAAERGVKVTLVTTPANAHLVQPTVDLANSRPASPDQPHMDLRLIPFPSADFGLPDGCENPAAVPDPALLPNFFSALFSLHGALDTLLRDLRPVDALVSDAFYFWTTALAAEHGIPRFIFYVTGLFALCIENDIYLHRLYESVSSRSEPFSIPGFPHPVKLTHATISENFNTIFMPGQLRESELNSYGVIVNSFYALEPDYAEHYYKVGPRKVFLVGPVKLAGTHPHVAEKKEESTTASRDATLSWLDDREEDSVVYVSFGTLCEFSEEQLRELALGLEASGHSFVWVLRVKGEKWMPEGYEERVAGRGLVVRGWVPQVDILAHRAVGGFVVQCGWNSVMEGVCAGLALATWPLRFEQFVTEKLLVDVLKIATPVWEGFKTVVDEEKVVVPAEAVEKAVKWLVGGGEEVAAARRRVRELAEMGRQAVAEGGSSYEDMSRLIEGLMLCRQEREKSREG